MRLIFNLIVIIFFAFIQCEYVASYRSKTNIPSMRDIEASQWLSSNNIPRRWKQQGITNKLLDEVDQSFKKLQSINENGIRQFDTQSIDGVSMEVLYELTRRGK